MYNYQIKLPTLPTYFFCTKCLYIVPSIEKFGYARSSALIPPTSASSLRQPHYSITFHISHISARPKYGSVLYSTLLKKKPRPAQLFRYSQGHCTQRPGLRFLGTYKKRIRIRIIKPAAYAPRIPLIFLSLSFVFSATARRVDAVVQRRALTIDMDDCPCKSPEQTDRQTGAS